MKWLLSIILLISISANAQRVKRVVTIGAVSYRLYIDFPAGYDTSVYYPLLFFATGSGEVGTDSTAAVSNGPNRMIANGSWNGVQVLGDSTFGFLTVTWQQPASQLPSRNFVGCIDTLLKYYKIDTNRVYTTGLSLGAQVQESVALMDTTWKNRITSMVGMSSGASVGGTLDSMIKFNRIGGLYWYITGVTDPSAISASTFLSACPWAYSQATSTLNGHSGWNNVYNPSFIFPGTSYNCYQLALLSSKRPYASASADTLNIGGSSTTLNGIPNQYPTGYNGRRRTTSWSKISGTGGSITTPNADTTTITGLTPGQYIFRFTSQNGGGDTRSAFKNVVVNVSAPSGSYYTKPRYGKWRIP